VGDLGRALRLLVEPVPAEKRELLEARWADLDPRWREPLQGFGRQTTGCGATLGVSPRCDFDCRGCYLGDDANAVPPATWPEIRRQLERLRRHLGPKGNLQITDGEVTLLPERELIRIVTEARRLGLIPMVMTHGESFRRRPRMLEHLVEAGLTEVSIHVDSLQRGRRDAYRHARSETQLEPLREEFAEQVRDVRRRTGRRLRAATTLTVARGNLEEVPAVVEGALRRRDAIGLVSFQPLARVGRTRSDLRGVAADELWHRVGRALHPYGFDAARRGPLRLGHPACTRVEPMLVLEWTGSAPRVLPVVRPDRPEDLEIAARFLASALAGLAFRDDTPAERLLRVCGALASSPGFLLVEVAAWIRERAAEIGTSPAGLVLDLLRGEVRADSFQIVSHHFMSPSEAASPAGRERLGACVFRVPIDGRMVPMCEANARGARDAFYSRLAASAAAASGARREGAGQGSSAGTASR
jgi:hypothetical protein